jgi:hypothetical protein
MPCGTNNANAGKHPRWRKSDLEHGLQSATTDADRIRAWWALWPDANIGIPTGGRTFWVLDVDPDKGGTESLAALIARHGPLSETVEHLTGGGGRHVLFSAPSGLVIHNSASALGPGLDVRGDGGYIVAAPSRHRSGRGYEWEAAHHPDEVAVAPAPEWLLRLVLSSAATNGHGNGHHAAEDWAALLLGAPYGQPHAVVCRIAGHYLGLGLPEAEVVEILLGFAVRCRPPHDAADVRRVVRDLAAKDATREQTDPSAGLGTRTWRELVEGPRQAIEHHWPGWIPLAAVALLVGAGETFKSWLALTLAISTAAGRSLFAQADEGAMRRGPVLYITGENAIDEEARRCQLLQAALGLPLDLPITFLPAESLNLSRDEDYQAVLAVVAHLQPVLIVVDSAIAVSGVNEERDNSAVRAFMQTRILPLARRHHATVVVIGHSPKPPQQPGMKFTDEHVARGASDWRNAADVVLYLRRDPSLGHAAVVLRHAKVRIGRRHAPLWFTLDESTAGAVALTLGGSYDEAAAQATGALAKAIASALEVLRTSPGLFAGDLVKQLASSGIAQATARRAVGVLRGSAKHPWPHGPLAGKVFAVVDEAPEGRRTRLVLAPTLVDQAVPTLDAEGDAA